MVLRSVGNAGFSSVHRQPTCTYVCVSVSDGVTSGASHSHPRLWRPNSALARMTLAADVDGRRAWHGLPTKGRRRKEPVHLFVFSSAKTCPLGWVVTGRRSILVILHLRSRERRRQVLGGSPAAGWLWPGFEVVGGNSGTLSGSGRLPPCGRGKRLVMA